MNTSIEQKYRRQIIEHYNCLCLPLLMPDIPLEKVFVNLNLEISQINGLNFEEKQAKLEGRLSIDAERREFIRRHTQQPPKTVTLSVAEALLKLRRLLVIGGPGSGKTTLARWLALTFARNKQTELLGAQFGPRLPILLTLRHFADHTKAFSEQPTVPDLADAPCLHDEIANYISQLTAFVGTSASFIHEQLAQGRCLLLIDGLDEITNINARHQVIRAIHAFFQRTDRAYQDNLCLITSRSSGYLETKLDPYFKNFFILPFTIEDVRLALNHWYDDADTSNLLEAIRENQQITDLATNPLLCTMIAILYRNNRKRILLGSRASLYEEYCKASLRPHNKMPSLESGPLYRYDWQTKLELLAPLAYWLHRHALMTHNRSRLVAPFDSFVNQLSQILIEKFLYSPMQAHSEARRFLIAIRDHSGLLQEYGDGSLSFAHRTAQEYLAARHIAAHPQEQMIDLVMPHLHDAWWREVHLLVIGHLGSNNTTAPQAAALLEQILTVYRPPWPRLHSYSLNLPIPKWCEDLEYLFKKEIEIDIKYIISVVMLPLIFVVVLPLIFFVLISQLISLPLALLVHAFPKWQLTRKIAWALGREFELAAAGYAECVYTTKAIDQLLNDKATERLLYLISESPYTDEALGLQRSAKQIWKNFGYDRVIDTLLKALAHGQCHVRREAVSHLGQLRQANPVVVNALAKATSDRDLSVRERAAESLVLLGEANPEVVKPILATLANRNYEVREAIISHFGESGKISPQVINDLLAALTDNNWRVRGATAHSLGQLGQATEQILTHLLERLTDESSYVRRTAAKSLGKLGQANPRVISTLLTALTNEESRIREGAARSLGKLGQTHPVIISGLLAALADREWKVRQTAAVSLGQLEPVSPQVPIHLLATLTTDEEIWVRMAAADSLGELGQASPEIIESLLAALSDRALQTTAASSLIQLDGTNPELEKSIQAVFPRWTTKIPTSALRPIITPCQLSYRLATLNQHYLYDWTPQNRQIALEIMHKLVKGHPLPSYQWISLEGRKINRQNGLWRCHANMAQLFIATSAWHALICLFGAVSMWRIAHQIWLWTP